MLQLVLSVGFAVLISAVCSLFEAVLYSVPLSHVESMIQKHRFGGSTFKHLRRNVDRPIAAILSLNTIANTAGAAFAGAAATAGVAGDDDAVNMAGVVNEDETADEPAA